MMPGNFESSDRGNSYKQWMLGFSSWLDSKKYKMLSLSLLCILLLSLLHFFISAVQITPGSTLQKILESVTIILLCLTGLSVLWSSIIPIGISVLGLLLLYAGIVLPSYGYHLLGESYFKGVKTFITQQSILEATDIYFYLGLSMLCLSMIIAFKPSLLYTRNRPKPLDSFWEKFSIWSDDYKDHGSTFVNDRYLTEFREVMIPLKDLMNEKERYLLWRYEYILTDIHKVPYLVEAHSSVPQASKIIRDDKSGLMIGTSRFPGYFM